MLFYSYCGVYVVSPEGSVGDQKQKQELLVLLLLLVLPLLPLLLLLLESRVQPHGYVEAAAGAAAAAQECRSLNGYKLWSERQFFCCCARTCLFAGASCRCRV